MTALNLMKIEDRLLNQDSDSHVISIASWKIRNFNEHLLKRFPDIRNYCKTKHANPT